MVSTAPTNKTRYSLKTIILSIITWSCLTFFGYVYWTDAYHSSLLRKLSADSILLGSAGGLQRRFSLSLIGLRSSGLIPSSQEHRSGLYVIKDNVRSEREEKIHIETDLPGLSTIDLITCDKFHKSQIDSFVAAIKGGASWIYLPDTRQETNYSSELRKFNFLGESSGLVPSARNQQNLNFHFIPREDTPKDDQHSNSYFLAKFKTPSVQTIFQTSDTHVDTFAPLIVINTSAPFYFSRHDTLYSYRAFWALLPFDLPENIWSLWAGKLLQELDDYIIYHSPLKPKDTSIINLNNNVVPDSSKKLLYSQWNCLKRHKFFTCMLTWSIYLVKFNILKEGDITRIKEWIQVLLSSGYSEPVRLYKRSDEKKLNTVQFYPTRHDVIPPKPDVKNVFNGKCSEKELAICDLHKIEKLKHVNNTLLLIIFNVAGFYQNIEKLEELYRPFFSQIIYCGSNIKDFRNTALKYKRTSISFLEVEANHFDEGQQGFLCIQAVVFLNYQVRGYLHLADDVLLNMWNVMNELPSDQFWFQHDVKVANINQDLVEDIDVNKRWVCWIQHHGSHRTRDAFKYLNSQTDTKTVNFVNLLDKNAGGKNRTYYQASDFVHVPIRFAKDFAYFINIFDKHSVHMEITFPTIMHGLVPSEEILKFPANYVWHAFRSLKFYKERYQPYDAFMHPIKISKVLKDPDFTSFYCTRYLSCWYKHLV